MSSHRVVRSVAVGLGILAGLACGDYAHPTSPTSPKLNIPTAPVGASFSRYILISGVWVCIKDCDTSVSTSSSTDSVSVSLHK
jgi:hypothetical protein